MVRYGIIGSGMMAQEHMRNLAMIEGAEVTGIADPDERMRIAAGKIAPDAASFADYKELLSTDLCDAYLIAGPNDLHHQMMQDVLPTGKPILCEKPLCTTSQDCRDIMAKAEGRVAPVWVAMEYRFMPPAQRLLAEVANGTIGTPRMFAIREHRYPFLSKVGNWNRFSDRTGGTMVEKCCHFWDLMRLVLQSDPVRVYCSGAMDVNHVDETYDGRTPDIIDNAFAVIDFANGRGPYPRPRTPGGGSRDAPRRNRHCRPGDGSGEKRDHRGGRGDPFGRRPPRIDLLPAQEVL
jgi:predicted dehydrogenase